MTMHGQELLGGRETSRRSGFLVFAVLLALAGSATAVSAAQPSAKLCATENSTPETAECMEKALEGADKALNEAYRKALSVIDADDSGKDAKAKTEWKAQLAAAQRAWIAFRDADCGALIVSEWNSGSGTTTATYACLYDKTVQRTGDILSRYPLH